MEGETEKPVFKKKNLSEVNPIVGKKRQWKSLKQILAHEKTLPWKETDATYSTVNAPPSLKPAKKYSDISGLIAPYTDPHTKLRYHNAEEYQTIRTFPMDLTAGYLALRGATSIVAAHKFNASVHRNDCESTFGQGFFYQHLQLNDRQEGDGSDTPGPKQSFTN